MCPTTANYTVNRGKKPKRKHHVTQSPLPRLALDPGSPEWCYQTIELLRRCYHFEQTEREGFDKYLAELREHRAWEKFPVDKPYGSESRMIEAELGKPHAEVLQFVAANYIGADAEYVAAHRFIYGDIGAYVAESALLIRDHLMRSGFVLPTLRLAPVAPYGHCMALSGNSRALDHVAGLSEGIWIYLHREWFGARGRNLVD